ncbi:response regulator transcription factor [Paenibacillus athensensis]|nr:response regulator transcription factor [Paenibacillus athensensis]MCD1257415.1 response regulator transcription factor [Paenibacillus athensensis]
MIKVALVDGQMLVSEGIKFMLEKDPDVRIAGCAFTLEDTLRICRQDEPDVLILDVQMSGCDGWLLLGQLQREFPDVRVVVLTESREIDTVIRAMNAGARGYMLKTIHPQELLMTVKSAALGLSVMHKDVMADFIRFAPGYHQSRQEEAKASWTFHFTERELMIIKHVSQGKENSEIAKSLFLSVGTVKNTISTILRKQNLRDRVELVVFAVKNDLL